MPFRRGGIYRIEIRRLPGFGAFPETSTYVASKSVARQMEVLLKQIAGRGLGDPSWYALLDALRSGRRGKAAILTLPELLRAHNEGTLEDLRFHLKDPPLSEAIADYIETGTGYYTENGLAILDEIAKREFGEKCRLSVLRIGKNIVKICARAEREGGRSRKKTKAFQVGDFDGSPLSRNAVCRQVKTAISKLCRFHFGNALRDSIFSDVQYSTVDDGRDVFLNALQLNKLLRACDGWFRPFVLTAALTGADRAPLIRMRIADVQVSFRVDLGIRVATLYLRDSKNDARPRTVSVIGPAAATIAELIEGRGPEEPVFRAWFDSTGHKLPLTADRVRKAFERAREAAGFVRSKGWIDDLRFKDLRHTAGVAFEDAGLSSAKRQAAMGHKRADTQLRYTRRRAVSLGAEEAIRVAAQLGIIHDLPDKDAEAQI